mmetsp:Transcript_17520/g.54307  ORF Transcript_17520/g.54307 Transcript_17520/m.54307 type:complete len:484 (+) Transcript_17520:123-1574(+)
MPPTSSRSSRALSGFCASAATTASVTAAASISAPAAMQLSGPEPGAQRAAETKTMPSLTGSPSGGASGVSTIIHTHSGAACALYLQARITTWPAVVRKATRSSPSALGDAEEISSDAPALPACSASRPWSTQRQRPDAPASAPVPFSPVSASAGTLRSSHTRCVALTAKTAEPSSSAPHGALAIVSAAPPTAGGRPKSSQTQSWSSPLHTAAKRPPASPRRITSPKGELSEGRDTAPVCALRTSLPGRRGRRRQLPSAALTVHSLPYSHTTKARLRRRTLASTMAIARALPPWAPPWGMPMSSHTTPPCSSPLMRITIRCPLVEMKNSGNARRPKPSPRSIGAAEAMRTGGGSAAERHVSCASVLRLSRLSMRDLRVSASTKPLPAVATPANPPDSALFQLLPWALVAPTASPPAIECRSHTHVAPFQKYSKSEPDLLTIRSDWPVLTARSLSTGGRAGAGPASSDTGTVRFATASLASLGGG